MSEKVSTRGGSELAILVKELFAQGQTDYSLDPIVLTDRQGKAIGRITDGDSVIFCCRRGEREVELTEAFTQPDFPHFTRPEFKHLNFVILTLYHEKFKDLPVAFAPSKIQNTLAEVVSRAGLHQLHTSESEKFAHVTFFFNGGNNSSFPGEEDKKIPSPKGIPFDQAPGLSLSDVEKTVIEGITTGSEFIVANFANGDVIGHTSNNEAKIKCAGIVDVSLGKVLEAANKKGYVVLVTADHGNLEEMLTPEGTPHVSHTSNPVSLIVIDPRSPYGFSVKNGILADIAPTILAAMSLDQPAEMTGTNLVPGHGWKGKRKVMLLILDGWGIGKAGDTNPIYIANTPVWDDLLARYPNSQLQASGEAVGLVAGKTGNSEAGHINLGAGRVVLQDDVRLDQAMKDGSFYQNEIFLSSIEEAKRTNHSLHLLALLTEKSSHGSIDYPLAILKMAKAAGLEKVFVHVIFDGRSTEPGSAPALLEKLEAEMNEIGLGEIVSGIGRGIALDRDGNYGKIQKAFDLLVNGKGKAICKVG
ncbi:MAG: phosphoglycerate mutase (2,3-diphosphoglycerate-independent) [Anaerolineaceae bacterium]